MQNKKSPSANLEKKRSVFLQTGFIAATSFALASFVWTSYTLESSDHDWNLGDRIPTIEDDIMPIYVPEKPKVANPKTEVKTIFIIDDEPLTVEDPDKDELPDIEIDFDFTDYGTEDEPTEGTLNGPDMVDLMRVEKRPHFKSCENILNPAEETQCTYLEIVRWVNSNAKYPYRPKELGIDGVVNVSFVIDENGDVTDVKVENRLNADLEKEAIRVVKSLPKFVPGSQQGRKVKVPYRIPVKFIIK